MTHARLHTHTHTQSPSDRWDHAHKVVGQLGFGFLSDKWSRTNSLLVSTVILIVFTALCAGSYYHGSIVGMFQILTAWRFFVSSSNVKK